MAQHKNNDLQKYHDMQRWLKGEKPPAQGRTWRRVAQAVLPRPARRLGRRLALGGYAPFFGRLAVQSSVVCVAFSVPVETLFLDSAASALDLSPVQLIETLRHLLQPVAAVVGSVTGCLGALAMVMDG